MKAPFFWSFFSLFLFFVALNQGCTRREKLPDSPILKIDETELGLKDFASHLARRLSQHDILSAKNPAIVQVHKNRVLSDFILQHLIQEELQTQKIEVAQKEVDAVIKNMQSQYLSDFAFQKELVAANLSVPQLQEQIRNELLLKKFFSNLQLQITPPSQEDIRAFYNRNKGEYFTPQRAYIRQIVVKEKHQAEDLLAELRSKKKDFSELATQYSIGPEALNGGLIGWAEEGQIDIFEPAFKLRPGQISSVIESAFGYHILKVERKEAKKQLAFDEVSARIAKTLLAEQEQGLFLKWLNERLRRVSIKKNDALIKSLIIETRGE